MDAIQSKLAEPEDMLPLEFRNIKRKITLRDNTSLNVVQRIKLNGIFWIQQQGQKTNDN